MPGTREMSSSNVSTFTKVLPICVRREVVNAHHLHNEANGPSSLLREFPAPHFQGGLHSSSSSPTPGHVGGGGSEVKEIVRLTIHYPSPSMGTMNPHKEISIRITNDENPMFFYHTRITDIDYTNLKNQQGLLVDFIGFPNQLISLLERCDVSSEDERGGPKFLLVIKMVGNYTVLDIVESNPFKYLCHLSLSINPGSDAEVKKYLAEVTTAVKKEHQILQDKYAHLSTVMEGELARVNAQLDEKNAEMMKLREEIHNQTNFLSTKHYQELSLEKEKMLQLQSELANKCDQDKSNLDRRHSQAISSLEERISGLEAENRELLQIKFRNETQIQENGARLKNYEEDMKILQQEITLARKQNERLDQDYHEKQRAANSLLNKVSILEADNREKGMLLQKQQEYGRIVNEQKNTLEDQVNQLRGENEKLRVTSKEVTGDLTKANEIIKKLQDEIWKTHSKSKMLNQINIEQERSIESKEKEIQHLENELELTQSALNTKASDLQKLTQDLEDCRAQLEAQEKTLKSNDSMIAWLNKQLNEYQGLSNLAKFRQNLQNPNAPQGLSQSANESAIQSQARNLQSQGFNAPNNTFPNNTPSWMHIYQSTSTPLDKDISSRLETHQISDSNLIGGSSKGHLQAIPESSANAPPQGNGKKSGVSNSAQISNQNGSNNSRPPTWAKGNKGKVTMENLINRPTFPIWKN